MRRLKLAWNRCESKLVVARHQWRAGTFFAYLENMMRGKKGNESVKDMVKRLRREKWSQEDRVAIFPRLIIRAPENLKLAGN